MYTVSFDDLVARRFDSIQAGDFHPTAVIGLGGQGCRIVRHVKARRQHCGANFVQILGIDADKRENDRFDELPKLSVPDELELLDAEVAQRALARAKDRHPTHSHILDYLPDEVDGETNIHGTVTAKIALGYGAGQFRRAGKLLFDANVGGTGARLKARLEKLRSDLIGLGAKQRVLQTGVRFTDRSKLFIVTSVSGGTGAGLLIDFLALVRLVFPEPSHEVIVIAVLPGEAMDKELKNQQEMPATRRNAIGTIAELQAIRTGRILPLTFKFDHEHEVTITSGPGFVHAPILVDNRVSSGNSISSLMSLCHAVANFIFAFVGSGVGAAEASAAVNILDAKIVDGQPHIFGAIATSYLEFPAEHLRRYAVLTATRAQIERWTTPGDGEAGVKSARALLVELGLGDAEQWRTAFHRELGVADYAVVGERREKMLRFNCSDDAYFTEVKKLRRRLEDDLRDYSDKLPGIRTEIIRNRSADLDQRFASLYAANLGDATSAFTELATRLGALKATLGEEAEANKRLRQTLAAEQSEVEQAIRRKSLDRAERSRYLNGLSQEAELAVAEATLPTRLAIVHAVEARAVECQQKLIALGVDLKQVREDIADKCVKLERTPEPTELGAWAITAQEFPAWSARLTKDLPTVVTFDPSRPDAESVVRQLFGTYDEPIWNGIARVDLSALATSDENVRRRMAALTEMARPLMQFTPTAPSESELMPMHFVAGHIPDQVIGKAFLESVMPGLRGTRWEAVNTGNRHLLICCSVRRGFAITHWAGFEEANRHYLRQRGTSHTLPNWQAVPTLHHTSRDEQEAQLTLGLGLFTEMIRRRGNNYYSNVERAANGNGKSRLKFATFSKERGIAGHALIEHGLVEEAMASERAPDDSLLGNSLEAAVTALRQPVFADAGIAIRATADELGRTKIGYVELKRLLLAWIENELVPEVAKATTRRDLLQTIAERLKAYAETLGKQV